MYKLLFVVFLALCLLTPKAQSQEPGATFIAEDCVKRFPEYAERTACLQRIIADLDQRLVALNANFNAFKLDAFEKLKLELANYKKEMASTLGSYIKSESPIRIEIVGGWCIAWHQENLPIMGRSCNDPRAQAAKIFLR